MASICCSPPDSVPARCRSRSPSTGNEREHALQRRLAASGASSGRSRDSRAPSARRRAAGPAAHRRRPAAAPRARAARSARRRRARCCRARTGTSPMIAFSVVVLPAPLRPSRQSTSPASDASATARAAPARCRRSSRCREAPASGAQIGPLHGRVRPDLGGRALGQDASLVHHGDPVRESASPRPCCARSGARSPRARSPRTSSQKLAISESDRPCVGSSRISSLGVERQAHADFEQPLMAVGELRRPSHRGGRRGRRAPALPVTARLVLPMSQRAPCAESAPACRSAPRARRCRTPRGCRTRW